MTSHDAALLDKMMESAGELLFSANAHEDPFARDVLKELAHHLGRLYGETVRQCKGYEGLQDEVTTTFMCGMALEPNFGREEEATGDGQHDDTERVQAMFDKGTPLPTGTYRIKGTLRLPSGVTVEAAAKTPGQVLFEKECGPTARPWDKLPLSCRIAHENKAKENEAEHEPGVIRITEEEMRDPRQKEMEEKWYPMARKMGEAARQQVRDIKRQCKEDRDARMANALSCWKCTGTGNMSLLGEYEKCDACG